MNIKNLVHPTLMSETYLGLWRKRISESHQYTMICKHCKTDLKSHDFKRCIGPCCPSRIDEQGSYNRSTLTDTLFEEDRMATFIYRVWLKVSYNRSTLTDTLFEEDRMATFIYRVWLKVHGYRVAVPTTGDSHANK